MTPEVYQQQGQVMRLLTLAELLLVDDDVDAAETLADVFQQEGYKVRIAGDGLQGLARLDEGFPDLVVLDVEMPSLDGPGMALQMFLRDRGRETIPILLCSGIMNLSGVASRVGTPYFLAKPYTLDVMLNLVAKALVERTPPGNHFATG
jgi:DNA-binding NtrC family response regulator